MTSTHEFEIALDADRYLTDVFFNPDFTRALHLDGLDFESFEVLSRSEDDGLIKRRLRATPKTSMPKVVRKVFGNSQTYVEDGTQGADKTWRYTISPASAGKRISIQGRLEVQPAGDGRCKPRFTLDVSAKIPMVGGAVEKFILKQFGDNLRKQEAFTRKWVDAL